MSFPYSISHLICVRAMFFNYSYTDPLLHPFGVTDALFIYAPASGCADDFHEVSFGRWIIGVPLYNLDETWQKIKQAMDENRLYTTGLKSSTRRYNPSSTGPGPVTHGAISVYTTEENIDVAGDELIQVVQHDIVYKTKEVTASGKHRYKGNRHITLKTLFWNNGKPSNHSRKGRSAVWTQHTKDNWHLNIAKSPDASKWKKDTFGYWCAEVENEHLTAFWHTMKDKVEPGDLGPVWMECPPKKRSRETAAVVLLRTVRHNVQTVGSCLQDTRLIKSAFYMASRGGERVQIEERLMEQSTEVLKGR